MNNNYTVIASEIIELDDTYRKSMIDNASCYQFIRSCPKSEYKLFIGGVEYFYEMPDTTYIYCILNISPVCVI